MIQSQLNSFFDEKLSQHLCGYRKGYTTQYALLKFMESWKKYHDNNGYFAVVLMALSKAFDTINHDLLFMKFHAFGVRGYPLKLIMNYLRNRYQHTKVNGENLEIGRTVDRCPPGIVSRPFTFQHLY